MWHAGAMTKQFQQMWPTPNLAGTTVHTAITLLLTIAAISIVALRQQPKRHMRLPNMPF